MTSNVSAEAEDRSATIIGVYSRASETARTKALDLLADDDGSDFKAEGNAVLNKHSDQSDEDAVSKVE